MSKNAKTSLFTVTLVERWIRAVYPATGLPEYDAVEHATGLTVEAFDGDQGAVDAATCLYLVRATSAEEIAKALADWRADVLKDCEDADNQNDADACLAGALDGPKITNAEDGDVWAEQGTVVRGKLV